MRRYALLATGLLAVLLAAAWTHTPIDDGVAKRDGTYREVLKPFVGQRCSLQSSQGRIYLYFPQDKARGETTQLVEVGGDYVKISWNERERYIPIGHVELLVGKRK